MLSPSEFHAVENAINTPGEIGIHARAAMQRHLAVLDLRRRSRASFDAMHRTILEHRGELELAPHELATAESRRAAAGDVGRFSGQAIECHRNAEVAEGASRCAFEAMQKAIADAGSRRSARSTKARKPQQRAQPAAAQTPPAAMVEIAKLPEATV